MTQDELDVLADAVVTGLNPVLKTYKNAIIALEQRAQALETKANGRPHVTLRGPWQADKEYAPGDAVVHRGALWMSKAHIATEPSVDWVCWQRVW